MEYSSFDCGICHLRIAGADYNGPKRKIDYVGFIVFFMSVFGSILSQNWLNLPSSIYNDH